MLFDVSKWDAKPGELAWKHPNTEISWGAQLIVNESQEAFLVREGKVEGPFGAGRHTLDTMNYPILEKFIEMPFKGEQTPFSAEVWYVNKQVVLDAPWGTPSPIQVMDAKLGIMVPVQARGQFGVQISDSRRFLIKLVATMRDTT